MSVINTNIAANTAYRNLSSTQATFQSSVAKLSSGFRINRAADDAAGLSIANKLRSEGRSLMQAARNTSQAGAVLNIADGAVNTLSTILDRMKELATEAASANLSQTDRAKVQAEHATLLTEVDRIVNSTSYQGAVLLGGAFGVAQSGDGTALLASGAGVNIASGRTITFGNAKAATTYTLTLATSTIANGLATATLADQSGNSQVVSFLSTASGAINQTAVSLNFANLGVSISAGFINASGGATGTVDSTAQGAVNFQVGTDASVNSQISLSLGNVNSTGLGIAGTSLADAASAQSALTTITTAIDTLNTTIGTIGAAQSRLDFASTNLASIIQNTHAAESTIRDADMAYEMTVFTKTQILVQAGTAMLAQANQAPQSILTLLRG
jgi:flagellin